MEQTNDHTTITTTKAAESSATSPFSRLAVVELQLILQCCDLATLLRLAGTSRTIRRAADTAHVWEHRTPMRVNHVGRLFPHPGVKEFDPAACFSPSAIFLRRHPLIGHFRKFVRKESPIPYEQLHIVDFRLVDEDGRPDNSALAVPWMLVKPQASEQLGPSLVQIIRRSDTNWRVRALSTSICLEAENAAILSHPIHRTTLQKLELHADIRQHDDPRLPRLLEQQLRPLAALRTLVLSSHSAVIASSLTILATFDQLTSLELARFHDDAILEFLFFTRGPLFTGLESLELNWITPMATAGAYNRKYCADVTRSLRESTTAATRSRSRTGPT
jgi:hypothetical protein